MAIRLSGLTSGMDTDAIVQELVSAHNLKTEKYEKQQTKLTWKQDAWKSLNTKIYGLYTNVSNMRMSGSYNLRKTSVSDATRATVTANSDAVTGTQTLNIFKTAQASYITGGKLDEKVTSSTKLSELGYKEGDTSFEVEKKDGTTHKVKVTKDTTIKEVIEQLREAGVNASFDDANKRIFVSAKSSGLDADFNLVAGDAKGESVLSLLRLNTALVNENGDFINGAEKYKEAFALYTDVKTAAGVDESVVLEASDVVDYINNQLQDYKDNQEIIRDYNKLKEQYQARVAHNDIFAALKAEGLSYKPSTGKGISSAQLKDMEKTIYADGKLTDQEVEDYITKNGIVVDDVQKVCKVLSNNEKNVATAAAYSKKYAEDDDLIAMSEAALEAEVNNREEDFKAAEKANKENKFAYLLKENDKPEKLEAAIQELANDAVRANEIKTNDAYSIENVQKNGGALKITGQDAIIELNGVEYTNSSNNFAINGLSITAHAATVTGTGDDMVKNPITISTSIDTDGIYDKIKDFLTEYNNVINEMTKLYNAESARDYEPLTDEEKEAMSEEQIEKWEDKIKGAILRRDGSLNSIMSTMINSMSQAFEIDGQRVSLSTFGISTLGFLNAPENEQNAFHIDGDEDDENTSGKKDKLRAAIEQNPDQLMEFMQKLMTNLYNNIDEKMKSTELSSAYKVYNDKELDREATRIQQMIAKWEEKVSEKEEYYYDKFAQMEVALSKLQNQTSSISGLLGQ